MKNMTVAELIEVLSTMNPEAEVYIHYDPVNFRGVEFPIGKNSLVEEFNSDQANEVWITTGR